MLQSNISEHAFDRIIMKGSDGFQSPGLRIQVEKNPENWIRIQPSKQKQSGSGSDQIKFDLNYVLKIKSNMD